MQELREAIVKLGIIALEYMSTKADEFDQNVLDEMKHHECNVSTDRCFEPFTGALAFPCNDDSQPWDPLDPDLFVNRKNKNSHASEVQA